MDGVWRFGELVGRGCAEASVAAALHDGVRTGAELSQGVRPKQVRRHDHGVHRGAFTDTRRVPVTRRRSPPKNVSTHAWRTTQPKHGIIDNSGHTVSFLGTIVLFDSADSSSPGTISLVEAPKASRRGGLAP